MEMQPIVIKIFQKYRHLNDLSRNLEVESLKLSASFSVDCMAITLKVPFVIRVQLRIVIKRGLFPLDTIVHV